MSLLLPAPAPASTPASRPAPKPTTRPAPARSKLAQLIPVLSAAGAPRPQRPAFPANTAVAPQLPPCGATNRKAGKLPQALASTSKSMAARFSTGNTANSTAARSPVAFRLTADFSVHFQYGGGLLETTALPSFAASAKELWHGCAEHLLTQVRTSVGIPIRVRSASALCKQPTAGIQLYTDSIPIASMCTHPTLFRILTHHATELLQAPPCFYTWASRIIVALPQNAFYDALPGWIFQHHSMALHFIYAAGLPYCPPESALHPSGSFTPLYGAHSA